MIMLIMVMWTGLAANIVMMAIILNTLIVISDDYCKDGDNNDGNHCDDDEN